MSSHTSALRDRTDTHNDMTKPSYTAQSSGVGGMDLCTEISTESFCNKLFLSEVYFIGKILNNIQN